MWKVYIKQIRYQLKENKFFSMVYILGTALSITMVMIILMAYHVKTGNIGVEDKRDRMLFVKNGYIVRAERDLAENLSESSMIGSSFLSAKLVENYFYSLKTPEAVSLVGKSQDIVYNQQARRYERLSATVTDAAFWKMYSLNFIAGRPFNESEVKGRVQQVVLDESTARRLFGKTDVVGYPVSINWKEYKVCGVVKDIPSYQIDVFSHIWYPYSTSEYRKNTTSINGAKLLGPMWMFILQRHTDDRNAIKQEIEHQLYMVNTKERKQLDRSWISQDVSFGSQPYTALESFLGTSPTTSVQDKINIILLILGILLLVPALNLSGLIVTRMRKRCEEIGIRKTFGASSVSLTLQILLENFIQMLIGGGLGLCMSFGLFQIMRRIFFYEDDFYITSSHDIMSQIEFWHIVNPMTVLYVITICFLLNLVSTLIPAWRYSRMPIVEALNKK